MMNAPSGSLGLTESPVQRELVERSLNHRRRRRQLLEVDEVAVLTALVRHEDRRRPAGAAVVVTPRDTPQIDGIDERRPDVEVFHAHRLGDVHGDIGFADAGRAPHHYGHIGIDEPVKRVAELGGRELILKVEFLGHCTHFLVSISCRIGWGQETARASWESSTSWPPPAAPLLRGGLVGRLLRGAFLREPEDLEVLVQPAGEFGFGHFVFSPAEAPLLSVIPIRPYTARAVNTIATINCDKTTHPVA